jgi:HSP20 family protein
MNYVKFTPAASKSFNSFVDDFFNGMPSLIKHSETNGQADKIPVNIRETEKEYILELIAPGFEKDQFHISLDQNIMTVSGEWKNSEENDKTIRREYGFRSFKRSFTLDEKIDAANISAKYNHGVLTLNLPRKVEVKEQVKQISVL